jgi:histidinol-phosphate/aromatic aminotransferase/cobyric acid decarboxylase-like protein
MGLPDAFRVTVGTREQNERCVAALRTVLEQAQAVV